MAADVLLTTGTSEAVQRLQELLLRIRQRGPMRRLDWRERASQAGGGIAMCTPSGDRIPARWFPGRPRTPVKTALVPGVGIEPTRSSRSPGF
jgi:hypothetical protein